jgi:hypothetical protein
VRRDLVADRVRQLDPVRPGADEALAPVVDERLDALGGGVRQPPEGVPVDVDRALVVDDEALAEAGQRVRGVERPHLVTVHDRPPPRPARAATHRATSRHAPLAGSMCS